MQANLDKLGGLIHSQRVMLALTQKGVSREDSYRLVQRNAMPVWLEGKDFRTLLGRSEEHTSELQSLMRISYAVFCLKKKQINNIEHTKSITRRTVSKNGF